MLDPLLSHFCVYKVGFSSFLCYKYLFGSQVVQRPWDSNPFSFQSAVALIRLIMWSCRGICRFAIFAHQRWRNILVRSFDHCIWCWLYSCPKCWMIQDTDDMEASCIFHVMNGIFDQLKQSKSSIQINNTFREVILTVQYTFVLTVGWSEIRWIFWD